MEASYTHMFYYSALLFIIFHELVIYPIFYRCCDKITSTHKVIMGIMLAIMRIFTLMAYNVIIRQTTAYNNVTNTTTNYECLLQASQGSLESQFSPKWITLPDIFQSASIMLMCTGAAEFLSSQVPYSMKGLMVGMTYCSFFLSLFTWFIATIPFHRKAIIWGHGTISCGFWYILTLAMVQIGIFIVLTLLKILYKKRKREDVLPNQQIFAIRYYSKKLGQRT